MSTLSGYLCIQRKYIAERRKKKPLIESKLYFTDNTPLRHGDDNGTPGGGFIGPHKGEEFSYATVPGAGRREPYFLAGAKT